MLLSNADRDRRSTPNLQPYGLTFAHIPALIHKDIHLYHQWLSCFFLLEWSCMILRQNIVIFSLDIKFEVFTVMSSFMICYTSIFQCPFLSKLHALCGPSGIAGIAGILVSFKICLIFLAVKKQDFWSQAVSKWNKQCFSAQLRFEV